ncbi:winged helix-turn-helix domain-containing protein [Polymorphospora sp. NPDC050346]|uniref:winged helix-turn-helix domain-containing protein n=1 Tax=Polymorphospora sp. NPDC050346 TaxID=3155780 RepID=UPI0033C9261F
MSVSPAPSRAGWHMPQPAGPGRPPAASRRPASSASTGSPPAGGPAGPAASTGTAGPALTVTLSIPLANEEALTPPARRLLDAARELLASGDGAVNVVVAGEPRVDVVGPRRPVRAAPPSPAPGPGLHLMLASRTVMLDGEPLPLTKLEFDLLHHLVAHPRRVFTRQQLLDAVWGYAQTGERTVDVHIRRLRVKIGERVPLVTTVYGVGYRLADDAPITIDHNG